MPPHLRDFSSITQPLKSKLALFLTTDVQPGNGGDFFIEMWTKSDQVLVATDDSDRESEEGMEMITCKRTAQAATGNMAVR